MYWGWKVVIGLWTFAIVGFIVFQVLHNGKKHSQGGVDQDGDHYPGIDTSKLAYTITVSQCGDGNFTTVQDAIDAVPAGNKHWIRILIHPGVYNAIECKVNPKFRHKFAYNIKVSTNGDGNFTKIQDAINSIPSGNDQWIRISLNSGTYKEQVQIPEDKTCIVLQGNRWDDTIITFDAHQETDKSPTVNILAANVMVKKITFENTYVTKIKGQNVENVLPAVALRVSGDKVAFYGCRFKGYQDTLWDEKGRHYFKKCYIEGAVDFIWGDGQSFYEKCSINVIDGGYITAQGRNSPDDPSGYVFNNCVVYGNGHACLGRAYGPNSRVIFVNSHFTNVVDPQGWDIWHQSGHEGDVIYAETSCAGPGSKSSGRVPWMKSLREEEMGKYTLEAFVDQEGWISKQP